SRGRRGQTADMDSETLYSIGELSRRSGLPVKTIRFTDRSPAGFAALMRSVLPELPDDPAPEQVEAWVELVELCRSADLRTAVRRTADAQAEELARCDAGALQDAIDRAVRERLDEAVAAGDDPLVERYWLLLATVNGWPASSTLAPVHPWSTELAA
ncbi:MerR family transcriptional regulator, partial [Streptomyces goshikiensis]